MEYEKVLMEKWVFKKIYPEGFKRINLDLLRCKLFILVRNGTFKDNRDRDFIINEVDRYLSAFKMVKTSSNATTFKIVFALSSIYYDLRPEILNILKLEGVTLKEWCKMYGYKYTLMWQRHYLAPRYKGWIDGYHFAQEQARKRTHPDC